MTFFAFILYFEFAPAGKAILPLVADIRHAGVGDGMRGGDGRVVVRETDYYYHFILQRVSVGVLFSVVISHGIGEKIYSARGRLILISCVFSPCKFASSAGDVRRRGSTYLLDSLWPRIAQAAVHRPINSLSGLINARLIIAAASVRDRKLS